MAVFGHQDADHYGNSGSSFFSLKNHLDKAVIRFLYNNMDDVLFYAVHQVEVGQKNRYVDCLRAYNEPVENCPFCAAKIKVMAKLFIPVYNEDAKEVQIWDRGKTFQAKLSGLCARYNPLVSTPIEVERHGAKGDTSTDYQLYPMAADNKSLEDFEEMPQILGGLVLEKTFDEMEIYLQTGNFPNTPTSEKNIDVQRDPTSDRRPAPARAPGQSQTRRAAASGDRVPF